MILFPAYPRLPLRCLRCLLVGFCLRTSERAFVRDGRVGHPPLPTIGRWHPFWLADRPSTINGAALILEYQAGEAVGSDFGIAGNRTKAEFRMASIVDCSWTDPRIFLNSVTGNSSGTAYGAASLHVGDAAAPFFCDFSAGWVNFASSERLVGCRGNDGSRKPS